MAPKQLAAVARFCNRYPSLEVQYALQDGGSAVVVQLERELDEGEDLPPVDAPRYPKRKEEGWWVVLGSPETNELLVIKRVNLQRTARVKLDFTPPESGTSSFPLLVFIILIYGFVGTKTVKLFVMCDAYLGCDQEHEVSLDGGDAMQE